MSKPLYIMVRDNGDGSSSLIYTMSREWINKQNNRYMNDELEHGDVGVDGDGFHPNEIQVPDDATYESLGISKWSVAERNYNE